MDRLNWALGRVTGYVGVTSDFGSAFTSSNEAMTPIVEALRDRGLLLVDRRTSTQSVAAKLASRSGLPRAIGDRVIDEPEVSRTAIDAQLADVERIAREVGASVAIGQPYPVTIERLQAWAATLEQKGFALAPISAVVDLQKDR